MSRILKPNGPLSMSVDTLLPENSTITFREWHSRRYFVTQYFKQDELPDRMKTVGIAVSVLLIYFDHEWLAVCGSFLNGTRGCGVPCFLFFMRPCGLDVR